MCLFAQVNGNPDKLDVGALWGTYQAGRIVRAASIHGMAREWPPPSSPHYSFFVALSWHDV